MLINVPIQTERLVLRCWEDSDFNPLYRMHTDPDVMRYLGGPLAWSRERAREHHSRIMASWDERDYCDMAVAVRETNSFIGWCSLQPQEDLDGEIKLSWRCVKESWGKGYATEAGKALLAVAFRNLGVARVVSRCHPDNIGMVRVFEKLGMKHVRDLDMPQYDAPIPLYVLERTDYERSQDKGDT